MTAMIELRGSIERVVPARPGDIERWVYCCTVCGFYSRKWAAPAGAAGAGLDHEERTGCVTYRAERLPF